MKIYGLKWHSESFLLDSGNHGPLSGEPENDAVDLVVWGLQSKTESEPLISGCLLKEDFLNCNNYLKTINDDHLMTN
jgi:hypothetical protein